MARPIKSTPILDAESSEKFLKEFILNLNKKTKVPTPKIDKTIFIIMNDIKQRRWH